jgi:S1-C subfamily serine protease
LKTRSLHLALYLGAAPLIVACGAPAAGSKTANDAQTPAFCPSVGAVLDLRAELLSPVPATGDAAQLALFDARKAALQSAEQRLSKGPNSAEIKGLRERLRALGSELEEEHATARNLAQALSASHLAVNTALVEASTCQGLNLRAEGNKERPAKAKAAAESKKCADTMRIVGAVAGLDTDSNRSSANVGRHLAELSMDGAARASRDKLSQALLAHAKHLAAFDEHTGEGERASRGHAKITELTEDLDRLGARCLSATSNADTAMVSGKEPPRRVTVLVRPTWEDAQGKSVDNGSFGSGVLVRWRLPSGGTEVRVVSNAHVLDGAQQADIVAADDLDTKAGKGKVEKTWKARVLRISSDDDLAVLRLEDDKAAPQAGIALRLSAPAEDEAVVAAGFPGIGARPSFQISRGTISNRSFVTNKGAFGAYLQHTAPIDPGNSGGPLFDAEGRLLGLNTIKIRGRDSVGLAIPTARVRLALERADDTQSFVPEHAAALCQAFVGELASKAPTGSIVEHVSISLDDPTNHTMGTEVTAARDAVTHHGDGPNWDARLTAFARLRVRLDAEGGVPKLTQCSAPRPLGKPGAFELTFSTPNGAHKLELANEGGVLRVVRVN